MPNIVDKIPQGLLTSSSGQGFAAAAGIVAGAIATHFGADEKTTGAAALLGYGALLLLFPQRLPPAAAGAPTAPATATPADDYAAALDVLKSTIEKGDAARAALTNIAAAVPAKA